MAAFYYDFELKDAEIKKAFENQSVDFTEKLYQSILINQADGTVTIDLSGINAVKGLYIRSTGAITMTLNGADVAITNFVFMTTEDVTSLTMACADVTGFQVDIIVWGA